MKTMLLAILVMLVPVTAMAEVAQIQIRKEKLLTVIDNQALTSTRWTGWVDISAERAVMWEINFTYSAATSVTMRCESSDDNTLSNDAGFDVHILEASATAGTSDSAIHTLSNATAANEKWTWKVKSDHKFVNCLFTGGGSPAAGDLLTVKARKVSP